MAAETLAIKADGVLYTHFGSFAGSSEFLPSLRLITFSTTEASRLNNSLLSIVASDKYQMLKKYCGATMSCKTAPSGTGFVTFYMFQVARVILSQDNGSISALQVIGRVLSKCICFLN